MLDRILAFFVSRVSYETLDNLCIYTHGKVRDLEKMSVTRFNLDWILSDG